MSDEQKISEETKEDMVEVNGQQVSLDKYLGQLNRHQRRTFLAEMKKIKSSKKIKLSRADTFEKENV